MEMESGEWQGFSDRELKNLRQSQQAKRVVILPPSNSPRNARPSSLGENCALAGPKLTKSQVKKGGMGTGGRRSNSASSSPAQLPPSEDIPHNAFFTHPEKDLKAKAATPGKGSSKVSTAPEGLVMVRDSAVSPSDGKNKNTVVTGAAAVNEPASTGSVADTADYPELKENPSSSNLELLQKRQKEIEAENKKKKALVEQTLHERYKKTENEARVLEAVKLELNRLDSMVTRDVSLLREKIEEANRDYTAARKRYEHAEAEFIAAKQILHDTSETKELLSEHLCNVIQQNEIRKAKKLAELLHALNVESGVTPSASMPSLPVLLQRTPTPGLDVWPRKERRKTSIQKTDSPLLAAEEKAKSPSTASSEAVSTTANPANLSHDHSKEQTLGTDAQLQQSSESFKLKVGDDDSENAAGVSSCSSPTKSAPNVDGSSGTDKQCGSPSCVDQDRRVGGTAPDGQQSEPQPSGPSPDLPSVTVK